MVPLVLLLDQLLSLAANKSMSYLELLENSNEKTSKIEEMIYSLLYLNTMNDEIFKLYDV